MKIYTRTGDDGTTALGTGKRVAKYATRVEAYGNVDETNASIGVLRLHCEEHKDIQNELSHIQNDLFDLGADLCTPDNGEDLGYEPLRIKQSQIDWIEARIDAHNQHLTPLKSFILPGGTIAASYAHMARTIARRAERGIVALSHEENEVVSNEVIQYMNRLSDYLFVIGRVVNENGAADILWIPGQNR